MSKAAHVRRRTCNFARVARSRCGRILSCCAGRVNVPSWTSHGSRARFPKLAAVGARDRSADAASSSRTSRERPTRRSATCSCRNRRSRTFRSRTSARVQNARIAHPSPDLLETVYICEQRQEWYRDFAARRASGPCRSSARSRLADDVTARGRDASVTALRIRRGAPPALCRRGVEALREFIAQADELGILVMCSGDRGQQHPSQARSRGVPRLRAGRSARAGGVHQRRRHQDRRRCSRSPTSSPMSGSDSRRSRTRTRGPCRIRRSSAGAIGVAAELLVPTRRRCAGVRCGRGHCERDESPGRRFKVSTLVILRRIHDAGGLTRERALGRLRCRARATAGAPCRRPAATSTSRCPRASASDSPARWCRARSRARRSTATLSACSASRRSATFDELGRSLGVTSDGVPARRQRVHPGEEAPLRPRLLSGVLGVADRRERRRARVSIEKVGDEIEAGATSCRTGPSTRRRLLPQAGRVMPAALGAVSTWATSQSTSRPR